MHFYQEFNVRRELQEVVDCIWVLKSDGSTFNRWTVLWPDHTLELIVSNSLHQRKYVGSQNLFFKGKSHVATLKCSVQQIRIKPNGLSLGVRLKPSAWSRYCNLPPAQFVNGVLTLGEFLGNKNMEFQMEDLLDEPCLEIQVRRLEELMFQNLKRENYHFQVVQQVLKELPPSDFKATVASLAKKACVSPKTLSRHFIASIGVSPKHYLQLLRFRKLLELRLEYPRFQVNDCAVELGFYDETHLRRDVRNLTGLNPSDFLKDLSKRPGELQHFMMLRSSTFASSQH